MKKILVIYASQTGHTERMAREVAAGAATVEDTEVVLKRAAEADLVDLLSADGLAIGSPENFGYMAGLVKDFFDRTYNGAQGKVFRKPYVIFISAGNDGTGALKSIERIALGYKLKLVYNPIIARGGLNADILAQCRELGGILAAGCQAGIF